MSKGITCLIFLFLSFNLSYGDSYPQIGAEIWIEPGQTKQQIDHWFKILAQMDMPVARIFMQWNFMQSDTNTWDFSLFDQAFASGEKYKVKIVATLMANKLPYFFGSQYWYSNQAAQILKTNLELTRADKFIETIVNRYKHSAALDTWIVMNEPGQEPTPDPLALEHFQQWLKLKYLDIKILNSNWLTHYPSFDSIQYSKAWLEGGWTWPVATIDWYTFWRSHLTWYLTHLCEEVKKYDTTHSLHVNPHALFGYLPYYELPQWQSFLTSLGASAHPSWHFYLHPSNQYPEALCFINDLIRGAAEPKPYWITELQGGNNLYSGAFPLCPTEQDLAQWLWTSVGSGAQRVIYWCLNAKEQGTEAAEWALLNLQDQPSERLMVSSRIAKIIHDNEIIFHNAHPISSDITILLNPQTMVVEQRIKAPNNKPGTNKDAHLKAVLAYYQVMLDLGVEVNIKYFDDYHFNDTKHKQLVILPNMLAMSEQQMKKLDSFIFNGNKVIATGLTGLFDGYDKSWIIDRNFPLEHLFGATLKDLRYIDDKFDLTLNYYQLLMPAHLWQGEIENKTAKVLSLQEDKILAVKNKYGKGEAVWIPSLVDLGAWLYGSEGLRTLIQHEAGEFISHLSFSYDSAQNHLILRTLENNGKFITVLANEQSTEVKVKLKIKQDLKPTIIYGNEDAWDSSLHTIAVKAKETVVMIWQ